MDYEMADESDVLFISDSIFWDGMGNALRDDVYDFLSYTCDRIGMEDWQVLAGAKCPSVKEKDFKTEDFHICRTHTEATINKVKPKLIIPLGNFALKLVTKKSGILKKRGGVFDYKGIPVVPTYHPMYVILEPRHYTIFTQDIQTAYHKYILDDFKPIQENFEIITTFDQVEQFSWLRTTDKVIAVDVETEGLDFKKHKLLTVGISWADGKAICIPFNHKESSFLLDGAVCQRAGGGIYRFVQDIVQNPNNDKLMHNAKFDLKFFLKEGMIVANPICTQILAHFIDETQPKGLRDLTRKYFPETLVNL